MKRTAIITGGSNGIGRAAVRMMAAKGIDVLFSYYSDEKARDSLLEELKDAPGHVSAVRADVGTRKGVQAIFDAAVETLGSIDILFNNAGVFLDSTFLTATEANLDRTLDVIVKGTFFLTQLVAKHMIERQIRGRIINTSSSVTKDQSSQPLDYCIAKAGINIMTTALARELGPYGITVNAVLPGAIPTKINSWQFADPAMREKFRAGSVLGELGDAAYIAGAVEYFISDEARWTTGALLSVDGGNTL